MTIGMFIELCKTKGLIMQPLSSCSQDRIDPTGKAREFINKLIATDGVCHHTAPAPEFHLSVDAALELYQQFRSKNYTAKHACFWEYDSTFDKKFGRQGGTVGIALVLDSLAESYARAQFARSFNVLRYGHEIFLQEVKAMVDKVGVPQPIIVKKLDTNASLPTMGKKGHFLPETIGAAQWRHVQPDLVGTRFQFQKARTIHQVSVLDVNAVAEYLARVRKWLTTYFPQWFSAWKNPRLITEPRITNALNRHCINYEGDYEHMDEGFGRQIAEEFILPLFEVLLDPGEFMHFAAYVSEMWTQPIFMGSFLLTGEHDLLSGVGPTQDFETYYGVQLHLGAEFVSGAKSEFYAAIGDDSLALFPRRQGREALAYKQAIEEEAARNGMRFNLEKCRYDTVDYRFCKRQWYPGAPTYWGSSGQVQRGAYPLIRTYNTIMFPERTCHPSAHVPAQLSRCDNAFGSPAWPQFVDLLYGRARWNLDVSAFDMDELSKVDWWYRVYGERWDPTSSITYRYLTDTLNR